MKVGIIQQSCTANIEDNKQKLAQNIADVAEVYHEWQREGHDTSVTGVPEFWHSASLEEVEAKGYSLVPSKYVEFVNRDEAVDFDSKMAALQKDMKSILSAEETSRNAIKSLFNELGFSLD